MIGSSRRLASKAALPGLLVAFVLEGLALWAPVLPAVVAPANRPQVTASPPGGSTETGCAPHLEHEPRWRTVSVRGLDAPCTLTLAELAALLERDLASGRTSELESLFLGRLVDVPELSAFLLAAAAGEPAWQGDRPPRPGEANAFAGAAIAEAFTAAAALAPVREALSAHGLAVEGASCEKVLVVIDHTSTPEWARGRPGLPYDAMCWIRLLVAR